MYEGLTEENVMWAQATAIYGDIRANYSTFLGEDWNTLVSMLAELRKREQENCDHGDRDPHVCLDCGKEMECDHEDHSYDGMTFACHICNYVNDEAYGSP